MRLELGALAAVLVRAPCSKRTCATGPVAIGYTCMSGGAGTYYVSSVQSQFPFHQTSGDDYEQNLRGVRSDQIYVYGARVVPWALLGSPGAARAFPGVLPGPPGGVRGLLWALRGGPWGSGCRQYIDRNIDCYGFL